MDRSCTTSRRCTSNWFMSARYRVLGAARLRLGKRRLEEAHDLRQILVGHAREELRSAAAHRLRRRILEDEELLHLDAETVHQLVEAVDGRRLPACLDRLDELVVQARALAEGLERQVLALLAQLADALSDLEAE